MKLSVLCPSRPNSDFICQEGIVSVPYLDQIVTGDCRGLVTAIPDASIGMVFADPPYWVGYEYGAGKSDASMDYIDPSWLVSEMKRVARVVCITPGIANVSDYPKPDWMIGWFKPASVGRSGLAGFNTWEPILVYGKPSYRFWQDAICLPVTNQVDAAFHTCPKPLALLRWLIAGMTQVGDIVLDPFMGSGTTGVAARQLGRHYIGFEIDPEYTAKAKRRIDAVQPPLFTALPEQAELVV